jgi:hypothetical protein
MNTRKISMGIAGICFAALLALAPAAAMADEVGAAAAVKPSSTGTPPGGATRTLNIGTNIVSKERIRTTGSGSLQVMFFDKTTLTIGPNSDLVIDDFVYKPDAKAGRFAANLATGTLRFVGGQISHTTGAIITTPTATIGIRGGAAFITHDSVCQASRDKGGAGKDCTKVVCTGGRCSVKSRIDSRSFELRISQAIEIGALGASQPFNVTSVTLNDVARGGNGSIVAGQGSQNNASFSSQDTVDRTVAEQSPEPPPPPPP